MRIASLLLFALAAATLSIGCGAPDSVVFGGFNGAIITDVRSAIHGEAQVQTTQSGPPVTLSVIMLSDGRDLCQKVTDHPDFFQLTYEVTTTMILFVQPGQLGTFFTGANNANAEIVAGVPTPAGGTPIRPNAFPAAANGGISVSEIDNNPGGEAKGSFDVGIFDQQGFVHEFRGNFKSQACPAMTKVILP
jgi:hypothetical protein